VWHYDFNSRVPSKAFVLPSFDGKLSQTFTCTLWLCWFEELLTFSLLLPLFPSICSLEMGKQYNHVDGTERRLIKNMVKAGVTWEKVQSITGRTPDTSSRVVSGAPCKKKGAPLKFSAGDAKKVLKVAESMIKKASANLEVTLDMILSKAGYDVDGKTVRKHFKKLKVSFFKLKEKPLLEPDDVKARYAWTTLRKYFRHGHV
jgi:hypothetical protein